MSKTKTVSEPSVDREISAKLAVTRRARRVVVAASPAPDAAASASPKAEPSKSDQILKLLRRKKGASLADLQEATGWQAHSIRGFLSGTVKKRMALPLQSEQSARGGRRYLIVVE